MANTKVILCGIEMDNPIIPASGTFGFGYEFAELYDINVLGAVSFKGTTREPRFGNPTPRIAEYAGGLLNAVGLQNPGVDAVIETELPTLKQVFHKPVMANVSGFSVAEYAEVCEKLDAQEQVGWYRARSAAYTAANGGKPLPALAFFHIALPEYVAAWRNPDNTHVGRAAEDECPGALNPGMFAAMAECGDVMGIFVGHDHDIDYVVAEKGIALGYGRFSGDDTTYNNLRPGVRILVLTEGERGFETWIHERDGRIADHVEFRGGKVVKVKNNN